MERAGAVGVRGGIAFFAFLRVDGVQRVVLFQPARIEDQDVGQKVVQQRVRPVQQQIDGHVVHHLGPDKTRDVAANGRIFMRGTVDRGNDILGGQILTVVEFDAFAQVIAHGGFVDLFPACGQRRFNSQIRIIAHQRLVDVVQERHGKAVGHGMGVKAVKVAVGAKAKGFGLRRAAKGQRQRRGCGQQEFAWCHVGIPVFGSLSRQKRLARG